MYNVLNSQLDIFYSYMRAQRGSIEEASYCMLMYNKHYIIKIKASQTTRMSKRHSKNVFHLQDLRSKNLKIFLSLSE